MSINNELRSARAYNALRTYALQNQQDIDAEGLDTIAVDLVTDLMHSCRQREVSFRQIITTAAMHFEVETKDATQGKSYMIYDEEHAKYIVYDETDRELDRFKDFEDEED